MLRESVPIFFVVINIHNIQYKSSVLIPPSPLPSHITISTKFLQNYAKQPGKNLTLIVFISQQ